MARKVTTKHFITMTLLVETTPEDGGTSVGVKPVQVDYKELPAQFQNMVRETCPAHLWKREGVGA